MNTVGIQASSSNKKQQTTNTTSYILPTQVGCTTLIAGYHFSSSAVSGPADISIFSASKTEAGHNYSCAPVDCECEPDSFAMRQQGS